MTKTIPVGTYKVEIEFTLEKDTLETTLDAAFEDAMYNESSNISSGDIGEYIPIDEEDKHTIME